MREGSGSGVSEGVGALGLGGGTGDVPSGVAATVFVGAGRVGSGVAVPVVVATSELVDEDSASGGVRGAAEPQAAEITASVRARESMATL